MPRFTIRPVLDWLVRVTTSPRDELTRWQRAARFIYDLFRHGARRLVQDRATQMAAALSYRTLFGLLPVLVVTTVLFRAFRGFDRLRLWLAQTFEALGLDAMRVRSSAELASEGSANEVAEGFATRQDIYGPPVPPRLLDPDVTMETAATAAAGVDPIVGPTDDGETLSQWLLGLVDQVENINFAAVGWVGLGILIYAAISLMVTIENSFNTVYRAPAGRSWVRRLLVYWTVLTLSPLGIGLMVYVNSVFTAWIQHVNAWQWLLTLGQGLWGFIATWLIVLLIYRLVPSTTVALRPVMAGAFVTAVAVEIGRRSLGVYTENLLSLRQLYGSLGLIPLFMFWVYLMWLVVLFGLEVAATLQSLHGRRIDEIDAKAKQATGLVDPAAVLIVMKTIADRFADATPTTERDIADETDIPEHLVIVMLERLESEGFIHRLDREGGGVTLARPSERIEAGHLMKIGFELAEPDNGGEQMPFLGKLRTAQVNLASQVTLAKLG